MRTQRVGWGLVVALGLAAQGVVATGGPEGTPAAGGVAAARAAGAGPVAPAREPTSGTPGFLGVFTSGTDLGDSVIYQDGANNIGVGTTSPAAMLHVAGTAAPAALIDVYNDSLGALPLIFRTARGTPQAPTAVQTGDILGGLAVRAYGATGFSTGRGQVMFKAAEHWTDAAQGTYLVLATEPLGAATAAVERMRIDAAGNVGIGTTTPSRRLHVGGDATVTGDLAVGTVNARYQDVAEWVASAESLAAGTVVVVDPAAANGVRAARAAYDAGVAGAVSAQPGLVLGEAGPAKALVAQSGRVRMKVDASYGAMRAGRPAGDERDRRPCDEVGPDDRQRDRAASAGHDSREGARGLPDRAGGDPGAADAAVGRADL